MSSKGNSTLSGPNSLTLKVKFDQKCRQNEFLKSSHRPLPFPFNQRNKLDTQ